MMIKAASFFTLVVGLWVLNALILTSKVLDYEDQPTVRKRHFLHNAPLSFDELTHNDAIFFGGPIDWHQIYKDDHSKTVVSYEFIREYPMSSPYTLRWKPKDRLGTWAQNVKGGAKKDVPFGKDVCFVHVGKSAGSSLGSLLGFQLHNKNITIERPEGSLLSDYTTHVMHNGVNDCPDDSPYYLWNLRSPLKRIQSAFPYDRSRHANNSFYKDCFQTLNSLGEALDLQSDGHSDYCQARGFEFIIGIDPLRGHMIHTYSNLRYYYHEAFGNAQKLEKSRILVIRVNHLEQDYQSAENVLAGKDKEAKQVELNIPRANPGKKNPEDYYLSPVAKQKLCEVLCPEMQIYKYLLRTADNLSRQDYLTSMKELSEDCPDQANSNTCPFFAHNRVYRKDGKKGWIKKR